MYSNKIIELILQFNGEETYFFSTLCQDEIYRYVTMSWLVLNFIVVLHFYAFKTHGFMIKLLL